MGQSAAQTVKEIEDIRGRLEADLRELQARLPAPATWAKRLVGAAVGGGIGGSALLFLLRRARRKRKRGEAAAPVQPIVQVVPEHLARAVEAMAAGGRWKPMLAALAAVPIALQVIELLELRRIRERLARGR